MPSRHSTVLGGPGRVSTRRAWKWAAYAGTAAAAVYMGGLMGTDRSTRLISKRGRKRTRAFLTSSLIAIYKSKSVRNITLTSFALTLLARMLPLEKLGLSFLEKSLRKRSSAFFALVLYSIFYSKYVVEAPVFRYKRTFFNVSIVQKMRPSQLVYYPTFWAFNRHAQTVLLFMLGHIEWLWSSLDYSRERVKARDGNILHLDWAV